MVRCGVELGPAVRQPENSAQLSKSSPLRVATLRPGLRPEGVTSLIAVEATMWPRSLLRIRQSGARPEVSMCSRRMRTSSGVWVPAGCLRLPAAQLRGAVPHRRYNSVTPREAPAGTASSVTRPGGFPPGPAGSGQPGWLYSGARRRAGSGRGCGARLAARARAACQAVSTASRMISVSTLSAAMPSGQRQLPTSA